LIDTSFLEYPDNSSLAVILYMAGCSSNCENCHNPELQEYKATDVDIYRELRNICFRNKTNKIVLCGGDPLYPENIEITKKILYELSGEYDICIYTGYDIEMVKLLKLRGFKYIKCGIFNNKLYIGSEKKEEYLQFASSNQKLYNADLELLSKDGKFYFNS
jgi:anaerobic ribonucleoside-triphosphate reductase activating protein